MDFDEVVKKRKMIREYQQDRQIPTDIISKLLINAHTSPSAGHTQVQEFIVVIDPITKRKLCRHGRHEASIARTTSSEGCFSPDSRMFKYIKVC